MIIAYIHVHESNKCTDNIYICVCVDVSDLQEIGLDGKNEVFLIGTLSIICVNTQICILINIYLSVRMHLHI